MLMATRFRLLAFIAQLSVLLYGGKPGLLLWTVCVCGGGGAFCGTNLLTYICMLAC